MALVLADRVQEYSTTTGTGTLTLSGAYAGFQTFAAAIGNGNTCYYTITSDTNQWEVGIGTVGVGTLARTTLISSSTGSLVSFTGTLTVFVTYPAEKAVYLDENGAYIPASPVFNGNAVISDNSANAALRITQVGAGNALLVEDSANPDATPFVVTNDGSIISGNSTTVLNLNPANGLEGVARIQVAGVNTTTSMLAATMYGTTSTTVATAYLSLGRSNTVTVGGDGVVASGDLLGGISFHGNDGAAQRAAAYIQSFVDGTPGTNDMPGRLVFSTTADGASSPTERMRIDSAGNVGIGGTTATSVKVGMLGTLPQSGGTGLGFTNYGTIASGTTSVYQSFRSALSTQAAAFTLPLLYNYFAGGTTIGAGSAVTTQAGFFVDAGLTTATNNYGFYSNIASGTNRFNFYAQGTAANVFAGTTSIGGLVGAESLRVTPVASAVNYFNMQGSTTGNTPQLAVQGSDTNIQFSTSSKGTAEVNFFTNSYSQQQFAIIHTASAVNYFRVTGNATGGGPLLTATGSDTNISTNFVTKGTGNHVFYTNGSAPQFVIANTTSAVNYLQVTGGATGGIPSLTAAGSDANINMYYGTKGTGLHAFYGGNAPQLFVATTASAVNYLQVTGGATGNAVAISAKGSDTNIDLALTPKGTGVLAFGTYTAGILAQTGYITIKDAAGNTRNLLVG